MREVLEPMAPARRLLLADLLEEWLGLMDRVQHNRPDTAAEDDQNT
jgi:hypothetical protein